MKKVHNRVIKLCGKTHKGQVLLPNLSGKSTTLLESRLRGSDACFASSDRDFLVCSCEITLIFSISGDGFARALPVTQRFQEALLAVLFEFFVIFQSILLSKISIYLIHFPSQDSVF